MLSTRLCCSCSSFRLSTRCCPKPYSVFHRMRSHCLPTRRRANFSLSPHFLRPSSASPPPPCDPPNENRKILSINTELIGQSGCHYAIEKILQQKIEPPLNVYLASSGNKKFVLKDIAPYLFEDYKEMYRSVPHSQFLRQLHDTIPDHSMFVHKYFRDHFLSLVQKHLPVALTKRILKDTLHGLAALHDQNIVHTDIKANNIMVDWEEGPNGMKITGVQLSDIEDGVHVPPGADILGLLEGNLMWRSPEAHVQARVNKPSDMWSFGIVCVYAVTTQVIFAVADEELAEGENKTSHILERQLSYFADEDGVNALFKYIGADSPWCQVFTILLNSFDEANPRKPLAKWEGLDPVFKDLVRGLTNFDPAKRLTAREALAHEWFGDI